jgi:hypothetical protein
MNYRLCFILVAILGLSSCASTSTSPNKSTLQNHRGVLESGKYAAVFDYVNGKKLRPGFFESPNEAAHTVKPGKSKMTVRVPFSSDKSDLVWASKFWLEDVALLAGETYKGRITEDNWCIKLEVVDSNNNVVSGPHYSTMSPYLTPSKMKSSSVMAHVKKISLSARCNKS